MLQKRVLQHLQQIAEVHCTLYHYSSQKSFRIPDLSPPKKKKAHLARENKFDENY